MEIGAAEMSQKIKDNEPDWHALMRQEVKSSNQGKRLIWREVWEEAMAAWNLGQDIAEMERVFAPINAISKNPFLRPRILGPMGNLAFEEFVGVGNGKARLKSVAHELVTTPVKLVFWRMGYAS